MSDSGSLTRQIQRLQSSDPGERNSAAQIIWDRYSAELLRVAEAKLFDGVRRREDEQDVVQDAFASFCRRQQRGDFVLDSRNDLRRLLVTITVRKVCNTNFRHQAQERDHRHEQSAGGGTDESNPGWLLQQMDSSQPTPLEATILCEEFERHLAILPDDVRRVVLCWIEGCTHEESARRLSSSVRSVARKLQIARDIWRQAAANDL